MSGENDDNEIEDDIETDIDESEVNSSESETDTDSESDSNSDDEDVESDDALSIASSKHVKKRDIDRLINIANTEIRLNVITGEDRVTPAIMNMHEISRAVGIRAAHISAGSKLFIDQPPGIHDPVELAKLELYANASPLILYRHIGINTVEAWSTSELIKPAPP